MTTTIAEEPLTETAPEVPSRALLAWVGALAALAVMIGALTAVFWANVVDLPSYRVLADGSAIVSERALAEFVAADAWFVLCGFVVGAGIGLVTWRWFSSLGWAVALLSAGAGLVAGLVCWQLGQLLGPGPFDERLAAANPGDLVPIAVELRSHSALAVWAFGAVVPVLLISALGPDDEEPTRARRRRASLPAVEPGETVDERGVATSAPQADKETR